MRDSALFAISALALLVGCSKEPKLPPDTAPIVAQRDVDRVVFDFLETGSVTPLEGSLPRPGALSPSGLPTQAGGDKPSLLLQPGEGFSFEVPVEGGPYTFQTAFGLDHTARELGAGVQVGYRVTVDGGERADLTVSWRPGFKPDQLEWVGFQGTGDEALVGGLALPPGAHVEVRARLKTWLGEGECPPLVTGLAMPRLLERVAQPVRAATLERPNILVIVMDTQRQDRIGCYGDAEAKTPHIDSLAERGLLFEDAHAAGAWTWPSTASMLTGLLPEEHGVVDTSSCYLASSLDTLPEVLSEMGYATGAFIGNMLITPRRNFHQGFDEFVLDQNRFRFTEDLFPPISEWLGEHKDERFFCYLQLVDTHDPYTPLDEFGGLLTDSAPEGYPYTAVVDFGAKLRRRYAEEPDSKKWLDGIMPPDSQQHMQKLYRGAVRSGDYWVGKVLERLTELGLDENTLIVFTSDHGEEILDHGLLGHGQSLHRELTLVPLIFAGPGVPKGRVKQRVENRNLAPTLAWKVGARLDGYGDGQDLLDVDELEDRPVFVSSQHGLRGSGHTPLYGVLVDDWLFTLAPEATPPHDVVQLFDLKNDPLELNNLAAQEPERVAELRALVEARLAQSAAVAGAAHLGAGEGTVDQFANIGYLDK